MAINVRICNQRIYKMLRKNYPFSQATIAVVIESYCLTRPRRYQRDIDADFNTINLLVRGATTLRTAELLNVSVQAVQRRSDKFLMHYRFLKSAALDYDHMKKSLMT